MNIWYDHDSNLYALVKWLRTTLKTVEVRKQFAIPTTLMQTWRHAHISAQAHTYSEYFPSLEVKQVGHLFLHNVGSRNLQIYLVHDRNNCEFCLKRQVEVGNSLGLHTLWTANIQSRSWQQCGAAHPLDSQDKR